MTITKKYYSEESRTKLQEIKEFLKVGILRNLHIYVLHCNADRVIGCNELFEPSIYIKNRVCKMEFD